MTDKETLFQYRLKQAEESLRDTQKLLEGEASPRSITNRAYYSMFYALLALFLRTNINVKTSKHVGVISLFDREFIITRKIEKKYSKMLHDVFDARLEGDYREFVEISNDEAINYIKYADEFLNKMKNYLDKECPSVL